MYCPQKLNVNLTGDFFADTFQYLKLSLKPCVTSSTQICKSTTEIAEYFLKSPKLQFMSIDNYINV